MHLFHNNIIGIKSTSYIFIDLYYLKMRKKYKVVVFKWTFFNTLVLYDYM